MNLLEKNLIQKLISHKAQNLFRERGILSARQNIHMCWNDKSNISFSSNDYLGLANHPKVITAFKKAVDQYGVGSNSSQLVTGYTSAHHELEIAMADFLQRDRALLFSNGYMANLGVITALTQAQVIIYADKANHASLVDAGLLAKAQMKRYCHHDLSHLQVLLQQQKSGDVFVVTDGVFSMDGSIANIKNLLTIVNEGILMVDDAHGIGVLGDGRGCTAGFSQMQIPILTFSLAKAFGCFGAIAAGSQHLIESLIQFAKPYGYTTAIPPAFAAGALASLELIKTETWRREKLFYLIHYFKQRAQQLNLTLLPSDTAIQALLIADKAKLMLIREYLYQHGFLVSAIRPPTVPNNTARLRITLTALHETTQIDKLLNEIVHVSK